LQREAQRRRRVTRGRLIASLVLLAGLFGLFYRILTG
jgi:hypothetical protein